MVLLRSSASKLPYNRSRHARLAPVVILSAFASLAGCGAGAPAVQIRASDFGRAQVPAGHALVLAFKAGDRIPVVFDLTGEIIEVTPRPTKLWLTAKRDFFLRIDGSSLKTSLDGVHFGHPREHGTFRIGLEPQAGGGAQVAVSIRTPVHAQ
jgi:hypothetical protein